MKMKKMVGALALTAALAMGSVPAFASSDPLLQEGATSDTGSTEVKAKVDNINKQVRAVVPLQVTVVFAGSGASDIMGPSSEKYTIRNIGDGAINIKESEISENSAYSSVFTLGSIDTRDFADAKAGDFSRVPAGNTLTFYYTTAGNHTYLTPTHKLSQAQTSDNRYIANPKAYTKDRIEPNSDLEITLGGMAVFQNAITQDDLTDTLCNIKYTIEAA